MSEELVFSHVAGAAFRDEREIDRFVAMKAVFNVLGPPSMDRRGAFKEGHMHCFKFLRSGFSDSQHHVKEQRRRMLLWATKGRAERGQIEDWSRLIQAIEEMWILAG
ncbi:hypothetical protein [Amycolatopsis australiensis]|uniref:Uncharacterized protein n=1 Tax=Amycolatopsis australiensis TaxID=546364 RepID=A0A1K1LLG0_9PSEU|nr:hypothetical protein [Amycolatopsis australiensis]SFW11720.1 hypothetical protein SAMN04489730_0051 [Amycolatopsis australiensis]